jgi:hypothetical protein
VVRAVLPVEAREAADHSVPVAVLAARS